jgi:hypothetical protein
MKTVLFQFGNPDADTLFNLQPADENVVQDLTSILTSSRGWTPGIEADFRAALVNGRKVTLELGYRLRANRDTTASPSGELMPYFTLGLSPNFNGPTDVISPVLRTDDTFVSVQHHCCLELQFVEGVWKVFVPHSNAWGNTSAPTATYRALLVNEASIFLNEPAVNDCDGKFYFKFEGAVKDVKLYLSDIRITEESD